MCTRTARKFGGCHVREIRQHYYYEFVMCQMAVHAGVFCQGAMLQEGTGAATTGRTPKCTTCWNVH